MRNLAALVLVLVRLQDLGMKASVPVLTRVVVAGALIRLISLLFNALGLWLAALLGTETP